MRRSTLNALGHAVGAIGLMATILALVNAQKAEKEAERRHREFLETLKNVQLALKSNQAQTLELDWADLTGAESEPNTFLDVIF